MKTIRYQLNNQVNMGTEILPKWVDNLFFKTLPYSEENEEIAKQEAYNGEYTIEDDGVEETIESTPEERIKELEEALELLLSGATE